MQPRPLQLRLDVWRDKNGWRNYVIKNHYLHTAPCTSKVTYAVRFGGNTVGVLVFRNPAARLEDQSKTLELGRMFLEDRLPKYSESRCLGVARRLILRDFPNVTRLISYSDINGMGHKGTIYKAAGWKCTGWTCGSGASKRPGRRDWAKRSPKKLKWVLIIRGGTDKEGA